VSTPDQARQSFAVQNTDPGAWYELARTLRIAAEPLQRSFFEIAHTSPNIEGINLKQLAYSRGYMLLTGLAFENVLKAVALFRQRSDLMKKKGGHGLVEMAKELAPGLAPRERDYLRRLEEYVVWCGRYPVPKEVEMYVASERRSLRSVRSDDPQLSEALFEKFAAELRQSS
jgi:hypothetical protein